jgi:hypothetical protein
MGIYGVWQSPCVSQLEESCRKLSFYLTSYSISYYTEIKTRKYKITFLGVHVTTSGVSQASVALN